MRRFTALTALLIAAPLALTLPTTSSAAPNAPKGPAAKTVRDPRGDVGRFNRDTGEIDIVDAPIDVKRTIWTYSQGGRLRAKVNFHDFTKNAWDTATIAIDLDGEGTDWRYADVLRAGGTKYFDVDGTEVEGCPITGKAKKKTITLSVAASCFGSPSEVAGAVVIIATDDGAVDETNAVALRSR